MISSTPVVELRGVGRTFAVGDVSVRALAAASLSVERGEYVAVVGPSGSGKSTMLNVLGLLDRPTEGSYLFEGIDTSDLNEGQRAGLRSRRIGFVFQSFHVLAHRSVIENVLLSTIYSGMPRDDRVSAAETALRQVGLGHRMDFLPSKLSGGERQRVAIARALVTRPAILLADEPTGNLDSATGAGVLRLFDELRAEGLTLVVVTHDGEVSRHADRAIRLRDGMIEVAP
ncbi:MAG: ABC transporter ATP-binding protein [Actinomycetota bacterium]|nr:ABC transporter ATP-binding protein [Actinomycetota bacterium]